MSLEPHQADLDSLRQQLLRMAGRVEKMVSQSVAALVERDPQAARATIEQDGHVNRHELETDALCLRILDRHHLDGRDLRFVTLALKMVTDLERIGDLAVNIAERVIDLTARPLGQPYLHIPRMADLVQGMIRDAVDAFVAGDADRAQEVIARDDAVDDLYTKAFRRLLELMLADEQNIEPGLHVQSVAKWLERMADHSTNLAEHVILLVEGDDVRHSGKLPAG